MKIRIHNIPAWHRFFARELVRDVDVSLVITGPKGYGKSTLTIWMMLWTQAYFNNGIAEVDPVLRSLTWKAEEWVSKMREEYRYQAIGFEEFGNATTVEEVNNIINEMIRKVQNSNRFLNILKIFNVPGFVHVPPKVRNTLNFWINVVKQGEGRLYKVIPEEGPDQRPMKFYKEYLGDIHYPPLPQRVYALYKEIKAAVELNNYKTSEAIMQDVQFKRLPLSERRRLVAKHILQLREKYDLETYNTHTNEPTLKWGLISVELEKIAGISISTSSLKRWFSDIFSDRGWEGIEEIANL